MERIISQQSTTAARLHRSLPNVGSGTDPKQAQCPESNRVPNAPANMISTPFRPEMHKTSSSGSGHRQCLPARENNGERKNKEEGRRKKGKPTILSARESRAQAGCLSHKTARGRSNHLIVVRGGNGQRNQTRHGTQSSSSCQMSAGSLAPGLPDRGQK